MLISFVVPAYNATKTIERTLNSVFYPSLLSDWSVEVLIVDDGSCDSEILTEIISQYTGAHLLNHKSNRGMCAGRNTGIAMSKGDVVTILDADDELVPDWPDILSEILSEWPSDIELCYSACRNPKGKITVSNPRYSGLLTLNDLLNERNSGEYLPLFRGDYVRAKPYVDLGMRKSCGIVSYINFALDGSFWITSKVLRIYHDVSYGSVTSAWTSPEKAEETVDCYRVLFSRFSELYKHEAPIVYKTKLLRYAIYLRLAHIPGAWNVLAHGVSIRCLKESIGAVLILILGPGVGGWLAKTAKNIGVIRRYG